LLEERVITYPPTGAGPFKSSVPVVELPPTTLVGAKLKSCTPGAWTVTGAIRVTPLNTADTVTVVLVCTGVVVRVKVAVVAPAATVTVAGTVPAAALDESVTVYPPAGAALERVTVPVEEVPPITDVGAKVIAVSTGAVIANFALADEPYAEAVIVDVVFAETGVVVAVNVPVLDPAAIVMLVGTVAAAVLLDVRVTV
jgi:hypothetical protein